MIKGKIIVIEGACDGIGKTTQYNLLKEHLKKDEIEIITHHFPSYGTNQGKLVELYLEGKFGKINDLSPYFINSLYALDRAVTFNLDLKQEYENGKIILLDRYTTSSLIYQTALIEDKEERKNFIDYVIDFEYQKLNIPKPDTVIFLTAPFDLVNQIRTSRQDNEGIKNDIHERDLEFMKKVYSTANELAEYLNWNIVNCSFQNEMRKIEDIHEEIYKLVKKR